MISLSKPSFDHKEREALNEVLDSGWVAGQGPKNQALSRETNQYLGTNFAIPVNNCTSGLHLALLALDVKCGDEVIVSDFTFPATGHAVMYCGAKPIFVDVDPVTYNVIPELIEQKINSKVKAIIVVHALGQMACMDEIMDIAQKHNIPVIEDAACGFGASYKGKMAGTYGDIAAFSFHARKNVTSGEGGIVVTNNEIYAKTIQSLSCFGMESAFNRQNEFSIPTFSRLGYNYKLSDINAAVALEQLKKYEDFLAKRFSIVEIYNKALADIHEITIPMEIEGSRHVYQTYAVLLDEKIDRNDLIVKLKSVGIQSQIGTYSSFIQPVYNSTDNCPNSFRLYNSLLALPLHNELTEDNINFITKKLKQFINN